MMNAKVESIYRKFVTRGYYQKSLGGLKGKYDNIRMYWEDEINRFAVRPYILEFLKDEKKKREGVKVVDLGCGSGQGYELLKSIKKIEVDIGSHDHNLLGPKMFNIFLGLDISPEMITQAQHLYGEYENIRFGLADLNEGLGVAKEYSPFDIYYSSYGALSHLNDESLERLLIDIAEHSRNGSIIVGDWLGKYSYEWPCYWGMKPENSYCEYNMSWIEDIPKQENVDSFPIRFWSRTELEMLINRVARKAKASIESLQFIDRSILVGRHTITKQYNKNIQPLRNVTNQLHQDNVRTDLSQLLFKYLPIEGFDEQNRYFMNLQNHWNTVVNYLIERIQPDADPKLLEKFSSKDDRVFRLLNTLDRIVDSVSWIEYGDPRANVIEPQLGYALRSLELTYQKGEGYAHGLVGIFRINK